MLIRDTKCVYRHAVEKALGKDATANDVLDYLLDGYGKCGGERFVIWQWREDRETNPIQRLNMFWAIPLTLFCAPYQYVARGQVGWDTKTAFGRWILRVTGNLHEI
jgi:hypothetical protein